MSVLRARALQLQRRLSSKHSAPLTTPTIEAMTFATLRALHTVIGDALTEMERIYALTAGGVVLQLLRPHGWTRLMRVPFYHVVRVLTQAIGSNV